MKRRSLCAFTLIELLVVIAIVGLLAVMVAPQWESVQARAQSITCMNNLRQIGVGVLSYVGENDNTYPMIEPNQNDPVYDDKETTDDGTEYQVKPMLASLEPYGVTAEVLKCPVDMRRNPSFFSSYNTSYQWRITLDDENATAPMIYGGRRGWGVRVAKPSRTTICTDFLPIHSKRMNRLYADGHVSRPY